MEFAVDKGAIKYAKKGVIEESERVELLDSTKFRSLSVTAT